MNEDVKVENGKGLEILRENGEEVKEEKISPTASKPWKAKATSLTTEMRQQINLAREQSQFVGCQDIVEPFLRPSEKLLNLVEDLNEDLGTPSHLIASMCSAILTVAMANPAALRPMAPLIASFVPELVNMHPEDATPLMDQLTDELKIGGK